MLFLTVKLDKLVLVVRLVRVWAREEAASGVPEKPSGKEMVLALFEVVAML